MKKRRVKDIAWTHKIIMTCMDSPAFDSSVTPRNEKGSTEERQLFTFVTDKSFMLKDREI
jgi:hypothetical protein